MVNATIPDADRARGLATLSGPPVHRESPITGLCMGCDRAWPCVPTALATDCVPHVSRLTPRRAA